MVLLVDIGNSTLHLGLASESRIVWHQNVPSTARNFDTRHLRRISKAGTLEGAVIASVVPDLTPFFVDLARALTPGKPLILDHRTRGDLKIRYRPLSSLGPDRIANAIAAFHLYRRDAVVVDMGTATTLEFVTADGDFIGGAIMPGLGLMHDALASRTGRLPGTAPAIPARVPAQTTVESIRFGCFCAHFAGIDSIIRQCERATRRKYSVIATGGLSRRYGRAIGNVSFTNPLLTLQGMAIAFQHDHIHR